MLLTLGKLTSSAILEWTTSLRVCKRSPPPGSVGVSPAEMEAKMAALPGKSGGGERLRLNECPLLIFLC